MHLGATFIRASLHSPNLEQYETKSTGGFSLTGIYDYQPIGADTFSVIRFCDTEQRPVTVFLAEKIDAAPGALVTIHGKISMLKLGILRIQKVLVPEKSYLISSTEQFARNATQYYQRLRNQLQQKITLPGSKLVLPQNPEWRRYWYNKDNIIICQFMTNDLMYAATVEFLFDFANQSLKKVYALEIFKGE